MGIFDFFSPAPPEAKRAQEVRAGTVAPSRAERAACYAVRDAYFACLDGAGIVDALADDKKARAACGAQGVEFERACAAQWVEYFKKWRVQDFKKRETLRRLDAEGANKLGANDFAVPGPGKP